MVTIAVTCFLSSVRLMMPRRHGIIWFLFASSVIAAQGSLRADLPTVQPYRVQVDHSRVVLRRAIIPRLRFRLLDHEGNPLDKNLGPIQISGLSIQGVDEPLSFQQGLLDLSSHLPAGRETRVLGEMITISGPNLPAVTVKLPVINRYAALVPAFVAIGLALLLRNVYLSLFLAIWTGAGLLAFLEGAPGGACLGGFVATLKEYMVAVVAEPGSWSHDRLRVVFFTLALGGFIGLLTSTGGAEAFVVGASKVATSRKRGQLTGWLAGLVIFFDDYANSLLVGNMMRPLSDRLRISREKLAFLIDSTAAPVAGLAIVSTWIGIEVDLIREGLASLGLHPENQDLSSLAYATFLESIPYRFYPVLVLWFVLILALTGRDFGPMARAEKETALGKQPPESHSVPESDPSRSPSWVNLIVPLTLLIALLIFVMIQTGRAGIAREHRQVPALEGFRWRDVITHADTYDALLISSFAAGMGGILLAWGTRRLSLQQAVESWIHGLKRMLPGVLVLVLAWGLATICDAEHLQTANCLMSLTGQTLDPSWMPAVVFLLSGAVSFATGSSWSTMALLVPISISLQFRLLQGRGDEIPTLALVVQHPQMLAVIGAVLAGSLFGDHCSPISDTTVLSSIAADCDHLAHVRTQLPYALLVGMVSVLIGSIPVGWGLPPSLLLPLGAIVLWLILMRIGRVPPDRATLPDETP